MSTAVAKLERQDAEVSAFLDACPARPADASNAVALLLNSLPSLRDLVANNPHLCDNEDREVLERCLFDMASDGESIASFVEFGLWVLDRCAAQGSDAFFAQINASQLRAFLEKELFHYSLLHKRHQTAQLPNPMRHECALEWCSHQGILCCSRCLRASNRRVVYCSRECQMKHWSTHRRTCGQQSVEERDPDAWDLDRVPSLAEEQAP